MHNCARRWVCLEPDQALAAELTRAVQDRELPACCQTVNGTLDAVEGLAPFDALLYIDVLEHIEDDRGELARASRHLKPGGYLVAVCPAHPYLFSPFDRSLGHFRRYTRDSLLALTPTSLDVATIRYLDCVGMLASLGNRLLLKQAMPRPRQIAFWDKRLVPISMVLDPLLGFRIGKSILAVWTKSID